MEEQETTFTRQAVTVNPGQGLPNSSEEIRRMLWQQEMTELINDQTRVLIEIRDILKEEQVAIDQASKEIMTEVEEYIGKHRRGDGQIQDKEVR